MKTVVMDIKSVDDALSGRIDTDELITDFTLPSSTERTKSVVLSGHGYLLSRRHQPDDPLLVLSLVENGPISAIPTEGRTEALFRVLRVAKASLVKSNAFPNSWRPYRYKNRISVQANKEFRTDLGGRTRAGRLVFERTAFDTDHIFAFALDDSGKRDLSEFEPDLDLFVAAIDGIAQALQAEEDTPTLTQAVSLHGRLGGVIGEELPFYEWYNRRLTKRQRDFVDHPLTSSIRLVGPAGSGKTVALVVKALTEIKKNRESGRKVQYLFLTHAMSTVQAAEEMILEMDPDGLSYAGEGEPSLRVTTLYALANEQMSYDLFGLTPVALDGHEGRELQASELSAVIDEFIDSDWISYKSRCSETFRQYIESEHGTPERRFFIWELMNEFACVLDADGVRSSTTQRRRYLEEKRKAWMMHLATREEREVIIQLYNAFRAKLSTDKAIGVDQMVTDFLNFLESYRWEASRSALGYDALFVDELHLFNRQERMAFRPLLRDLDSPPLVVMAYDAKQSPRDTFMGGYAGSSGKYDYWKDASLGKVEKLELVDVFRYTPQIATTLNYIDQSFPGLELDEEWPAYSGISKIDDGPIPTLAVTTRTEDLFKFAFPRARAKQRKLGNDGRVAVLCGSYGLFEKYVQAAKGQYHDSCIVISSRDEIELIGSRSPKFVLSMPEYVAGLQFDTVIFLEVNQGEIPEGPYSSAARRKFVSLVYLGASRAERMLEFYATEEHGGASNVLSLAVAEGAVEKHDVSQLD